MTKDEKQVIPKWFKVVTIIAIIWNLMGVMSYLGHAFRTPEDLALMPEEQKMAYQNMASWATAAFAIGTWCGLIGSIALFIRKSWSYQVLTASLIGVLIQLYHNYFVIDSIAIFGSHIIIMTALIIGVSVYLIYLSSDAKSKGWLT